jgi:hypothetical protein
VITCITKEGKSKEFLKKWRLITLLNSTYKLASSCIAESINRSEDKFSHINPEKFKEVSCKAI